MRSVILLLLLAAGPGLRADDLAPFERKAEMNPDDPAAQFNYAVKAREAKNYKAALKAAARVVALQPKDGQALELLGQLRLESGDAPGARETFEKAVKLNPKSGSAWAMLAKIYSASEDKPGLKKAADAFDNASRLSPKNFKLVINQGVIQSKLGDDKKALSLFERASQMEGGSGPASKYLCQLYNVGGDNRKAEAACLEASKDPNASAETFYYLGFAQTRLGKKDAALASFERSVAVSPSYAPALYSLGFTDYEKGALDQALKHFQAAVDAKDGDYPEAQFNVAVVLGDMGRWAEAADIYRKILKKDPKNGDAAANLDYVVSSGTEALLNQGKDSYEAGDFDKASRAWKQALELDPENASAKDFLANLKRKSAKQDSAVAARKAARQAVASKLKSEDDKVLKEGLADFKAGRLADAVKKLDFYVRKHPGDKTASQALYKAKSQVLESSKGKAGAGVSAPKVAAEALKKQYFQGVDAYLEGDLPKAIGIWKKILEADPGHLDASRSLSQAELELAALKKIK